MVHWTRLEELVAFIQGKMIGSSEETHTTLQAVLDEITKMNTETLYLIRMKKNDSFSGYSGWAHTKNEHFFEWSETKCSLFEVLSEAQEWDLKLKTLGWTTELITVKKNNLEAGDELSGFCNGFFGRDYTSKKVIEVGHDFIVVELIDGSHVRGDFAEGWQIKYLPVMIALWKGEL